MDHGFYVLVLLNEFNTCCRDEKIHSCVSGWPFRSSEKLFFLDSKEIQIGGSCLRVLKNFHSRTSTSVKPIFFYSFAWYVDGDLG